MFLYSFKLIIAIATSTAAASANHGPYSLAPWNGSFIAFLDFEVSSFASALTDEPSEAAKYLPPPASVILFRASSSSLDTTMLPCLSFLYCIFP